MAAFEALEDEAPADLYPGAPGRFEKTPWSRAAKDEGGGVMGMMRGRLFEKVGVHTSTVFGAFSPEFAKQVKGAGEDPRFWASGISLIAHMKNPRVPAVHMNTRMIVTTESWFGGGADLNPTLDAARSPRHPDTVDFHARLKTGLRRFRYGLVSQIQEMGRRPISGCRIAASRAASAAFSTTITTAATGSATSPSPKAWAKPFWTSSRRSSRRRMGEAWTEDERHEQAKWRGRYVEFNLLYDRGTHFGLKTGGNVESILSSMPPVAEWQ